VGATDRLVNGPQTLAGGKRDEIDLPAQPVAWPSRDAIPSGPEGVISVQTTLCHCSAGASLRCT
jgi:hypothetical protein